jgi:hypothetical protein
VSETKVAQAVKKAFGALDILFCAWRIVLGIADLASHCTMWPEVRGIFTTYARPTPLTGTHC